jgi:hypothetical protein
MNMKVRLGGLAAGCIVLGVLAASLTVLGVSNWQTQVTRPGPVPPLPKLSAAQAYKFPEGGRKLFPAYRLVALYGSPQYAALGALGQQPMDATITRVQQLAVQYQPYSTEHILPTLEIIASVASAYPTDNGDYSQETAISTLEPWVDAAQKAGVYMVFDLQPGRTDFLTQAKEFEPLLLRPNVGLALDPEWRLGPAQVPVVQIGTVGINEVNQTAAWLARVTTQHHLPQKLFVLHQFRLDMIQNRDQLNMTHPQLAYVIQMDGNGTQPMKRQTWQTVTANAPAGVQFGWKNFYKVDQPMLDPAGTMAITPKPWYISYQ